MLDGVTSTGTKPCRLRSRSHHRRAAESANHRLLCSSVRQATSWFQDQPMNSGCSRPALHSTKVLEAPSYQHVRRQIMQLCKGISWQKEILACRLRSVLRCWIPTLSRHMSKLSATVATGAFSQLGSSNAFCAVISRWIGTPNGFRMMTVIVLVVSFRTTGCARLVPVPREGPRVTRMKRVRTVTAWAQGFPGSSRKNLRPFGRQDVASL